MPASGALPICLGASVPSHAPVLVPVPPAGGARQCSVLVVLTAALQFSHWLGEQCLAKAAPCAARRRRRPNFREPLWPQYVPWDSKQEVAFFR